MSCTKLCASILGISTLLASHALATIPTITTFDINPAGPVTARTVVTLEATVKANGSPIVRGEVVFCNAAATHCLDVAVLGRAQLTSAGSATTNLRLGIGTHTIRAVYTGTALLAGSPSPTASLTVTGAYASSTNLSASHADKYTLTATLAAPGAVMPSGSISFADVHSGNAPLGSIPLNVSNTWRAFLPNWEFTPDYGSYHGESPWQPQFAVADLNGDGIPDLAGAQELFGETVMVLLGKGDGTFFSKPSIQVGHGAVWTAVADFNSDGIEDLAVTCLDDSTVTIALGNGDGTFRTSQVPMGPAPSVITTGDFNRDGIPDLATANWRDRNISVLLGTGDGSFTTEPVLPLPFSGLARIVTGDFNGDDKPDLAILNNEYAGPVAILLGDGDGHFASSPLPLDTDPDEIPTDLAIGDYNRDGILDLAVANFNSNTVRIFLGAGDGTFTKKSMIETPNTPESIVIRDFDSDGIADLAFGSYDTLSVQKGIGDGTFKMASSWGVPPPDTILFVASGDFNGDGVPDLVASFAAPFVFGSIHSYLAEFTSTVPLTVPLANGAHEIVASYSGDLTRHASESALLVINGFTATPVFAPLPGTYAWTQHITITDATADAAIYYSLDGSTPSASSNRYSAPITIGWDGTIRAIAISDGNVGSPVVTGSYSIERPMQAPAFSLPAGVYSGSQQVRLTTNPSYCANAICLIYYTRDGSTPSTRSRLYTGSIVLSGAGTTTIKAIATTHHFAPSPIASATYTLE